jgi:hypothetical protein
LFLTILPDILNNMAESDYKEKRTKIRIPFVYDIEFDDAAETVLSLGGIFSGKVTKIKINDISADGIQIMLPEFIPQGARAKLSLQFPRWRGMPKNMVEESTSCTVFARIQWIREDQSGQFRAGLMFLKLSDEARTMIDRYLEENISITDEMM